jgi:hypothetical protein
MSMSKVFTPNIIMMHCGISIKHLLKYLLTRVTPIKFNQTIIDASMEELIKIDFWKSMEEEDLTERRKIITCMSLFS